MAECRREELRATSSAAAAIATILALAIAVLAVSTGTRDSVRASAAEGGGVDSGSEGICMSDAFIFSDGKPPDGAAPCVADTLAAAEAAARQGARAFPSFSVLVWSLLGDPGAWLVGAVVATVVVA